MDTYGPNLALFDHVWRGTTSWSRFGGWHGILPYVARAGRKRSDGTDPSSRSWPWNLLCSGVIKSTRPAGGTRPGDLVDVYENRIDLYPPFFVGIEQMAFSLSRFA